MPLRELAWGGVYFSPLLLCALISFVLAAIVRTLLYKTPVGRLIWQEAWFDVALFVCILALVVFLMKIME
ncbi:DUF1656 domain-containing protein [Phytohalomonas tamaricis]|uniref:DUF1656 domain-containing protein n=1 Tax=Phytohalomonas tamaricis TaxID=2081032 RepID=UPI000D0B4E0E|nr:DUF1656 domain-containing protein [Phytohalomonas tamaricis]